MWERDITIDRASQLDNSIEAYLTHYRFNFVKEIFRTRIIFSVADSKDRQVEFDNMIIELMLVEIKLRYFVESLNIDDLNGIDSILIGEMLFFDSKYEREYLRRILRKQKVYVLDGIMNFLIGDIRNNWDYLIALFRAVDEDSEEKNILLDYIHEGASDADRRVYLTNRAGENKIFDVANKKWYSMLYIPYRQDLSIMYTILSMHAGILYIENDDKFRVNITLLSKVLFVELV